MSYSPLRYLLLATTVLSLSACNAYDRMMDIGETPKLATIEDPTHAPGYTPVRMPMPTPSLHEVQPNSLWQVGGRAFFRDQRASRVGDILTVIVTIDDQAQLANETKRSRDNTDTAAINNLLGFESKLSNFLPQAVVPSTLIDTSSALSNDGKGSVARQEKIDLRIAAEIVQILPNGNLVLQGKQQVNVNYDQRQLTIRGVIRPMDINTDNTITYDQIAEARIEYGGRGSMQDVQQPRYGDQLLDIVMPF